MNKFGIGFSDYLTNDLEGDVIGLLGQLKEGMGVLDLPSIFVIDEAHGLRRRKTISGLNNYEWSFRDTDVNTKEPVDVHERSPYNVFRRVFRMFTSTWEELMLIVISTSSQISLLLPELALDPSRRPLASAKFIENFSLVQTYNVNLAEIVQSISADMFPNDYCKGINDWQEFLKSDFRREEYFKFGRPLNYGVFREKAKFDNYILEAEFEKCEEFAFMASKLFGGKEYGETNNIGLLYGMFNFAFGTNSLPSYVDKEDLIENHLMTLVEYLDDLEYGGPAKNIIGGFMPEGVINFLSARYFAEHPKSLSKVFSSSVKYGLCDIGNFGELLAQFILLHNMFNCIDASFKRVRMLTFQPASLRDFLSELAGNENKVVIDEFFNLNFLLNGSSVSFGYFEYFPKNLIDKPFDLMARCLFKGSATALNHLYPGIDLMIPLVLNNGKISFLGIQVKFITKNENVNRVVNKALMQMNFKKMFTQRQIDRPFGLLILVIGEYKFSVSIKNRIRRSASASSNLTHSEAPAVLIFKGIPASSKSIKHILKIAPKSASYRGINPEYLKKCDFMHDLIQEIPLDQGLLQPKCKE